MKNFRNIFYAVIFLLAGLVILAGRTWAENAVGDNLEGILSYSAIADLTVISDSSQFGVGAKADDLIKKLRESKFGECDAQARIDLSSLSPRLFCRRGEELAVKAFEPFKSFIVLIDRKTQKITTIKDAQGNPAAELRIPTQPVSAHNLDEHGNIQESVRYDLLLGKEVDSDAKHIEALQIPEDRRFYQHEGTDAPGVARAGYRNSLKLFNKLRGIKTDDYFQGGSTITEQLAKLLYLADGENKFFRRFLAIFLADSLERRLTKRQILELWLNLTVLGIERPTESQATQATSMRRESVRGFKTAARVLFNKDLANCDENELTLLAVLPRGARIIPGLKNRQLDLAKPEHQKLEDRRRDAAKLIAAEFEAAGDFEAAKRFRATENSSPHFNFSEDDLKGDEALLKFVEHDLKTYNIASKNPEGKPVVVVLSTDGNLQRAFSKRLEEKIPDVKANLVKLTSGKGDIRNFKFEIQIDLVVMSAINGSLISFSSLKTKDNRILPNRSNVNPPSFVASTSKPVIMAYVVGENAMTLHTIITPSSCAAPNGFKFDKKPSDKAQPLWNHLFYSRNQPLICVGNVTGIDNILTKWREIFPSAKLPPSEGFIPDAYEILRGLNRPEAELTPTAVAEAYTALANRGVRTSLSVVKEIYVGREKLLSNEPIRRQIFKPEAAPLVSSVMRQAALNLKNWKPTKGYDLALKTGSTSNSYWVVLWSPASVTVVRYLITSPEKLPDDKSAKKFSDEVEKRFSGVLAGNVVKPFADEILAVIQQKNRGLLRGFFADEGIVTVRIDPARECATADGDGILAGFIKGSEPPPCPAKDLIDDEQ